MNRDANYINGTNRHAFHKVCTSISGLDDIFYGGLDLLSAQNLNILISGGDELRRTTFSLQLMYGISQYFKQIHNSRCTEYHIPFTIPEFFSTRKNGNYLEDLLLDMVISSSIQKITKFAVTDYDGKSLCFRFSDTFFDDDTICEHYEDSIFDYLPPALFEKTDAYICEGAVYYSNRTNSLHFKIADGSTDSYNILFKRRHDQLSRYFKETTRQDEDETDDDPTSFTEKEIDEVGNNIGMTYVNTKITDEISVQGLAKALEGKNIVGLDLSNTDILSEEEIQNYIETFCNRKKCASTDSDESEVNTDIRNHSVSILSIPDVSFGDDCIVPESSFDIIIQVSQVL